MAILRPNARANRSAAFGSNSPFDPNTPMSCALSRASTTICFAPASSHRLPCSMSSPTTSVVNVPSCFLPTSNCTSSPYKPAIFITFLGLKRRSVNPSPASIRVIPIPAHNWRYSSSLPNVAATSKGPPPVQTGTPRRRAASTLRRVDISLATCQQAIDIFSVDIRCALCSKWLSRVTGSYPGSKGEVHGGISGTPICCKYSFVVIVAFLSMIILLSEIISGITSTDVPTVTLSIYRRPYGICSAPDKLHPPHEDGHIHCNKRIT